MVNTAAERTTKDTREIIINSAVELFLAKGYSRTTLEDIVKNVGLTRGAFYWNFKTKKDILDEILSRYEQFYIDIYAHFKVYDSAYKTLHDFLLYDVKQKKKVNAYVNIIRYKVEACQELSDLKERQAALDNQFLKTIEDEIIRGQENGEFRTDKSARFFAITLYTYLIGYDNFNIVHEHEQNNPGFLPKEGLEDAAEFLVKTLLK